MNPRLITSGSLIINILAGGVAFSCPGPSMAANLRLKSKLHPQ